jgi:integrase/recombinase XerD
MDQSIFPNRKARRLDDAPFADKRDRYLRQCAEHGATLGSLTIKRNELLWIAARLKPNGPTRGIESIHEFWLII